MQHIPASMQQAHSLGRAGAADALQGAEADDPLFGARALAFIVNHVREQGPNTAPIDFPT